MADDYLRAGGDDIDRGHQRADLRGSAGETGGALGDQLRQADRGGVEDDAAAQGGDDHHAEQQLHLRGRQCDMRARRLLRHALRRLPAGEDHIGDAGGDGDQARQDEHRAPAPLVSQRARRDAGGGDAQIAPHAIDAQRLAQLFRIRGDHGDADRMIDRGEQSDQRQPDCQLQRRAGKAGQDRGHADAQEEHRHHAGLAPAVAQPAGGDRGRAEGDEAEHGE